MIGDAESRLPALDLDEGDRVEIERRTREIAAGLDLTLAARVHEAILAGMQIERERHWPPA